MNDITLLYKAVLNGKKPFDSLTDSEKNKLFHYMCDELEKGNAIDDELLRFLASPQSVSDQSKYEDAVKRGYEKLNRLLFLNKKVFYKRIIRRILAATVAIFSFIVFSLVTASAFGANFVEHVKTMFYEEESAAKPIATIFFESPDKPIKAYETTKALFENELSEYHYPSYMPEGVKPFSVTVGHNEKSHFIYKLKDGNGKIWSITASSAEGSYMPMGYCFETSTTDGIGLSFVYTMSRNSSDITNYTVYTTLNGVMYTLVLPTGDWDDVMRILNSFTPAK